MRQKIFEIIEVAKENDKWSHIYDSFMMIVILISIFPLAFKIQTDLFLNIDKIATIIFIVDYVLRFITADYKLNKGKISFVLYPFTFMAIIDLLSILPSITLLNNGLRLFKIFRLIRTLRVFRIFKSFRYSKNIQMVVNVFKRQKELSGQQLSEWLFCHNLSLCKISLIFRLPNARGLYAIRSMLQCLLLQYNLCEGQHQALPRN